jgi:O-antigen ligase
MPSYYSFKKDFLLIVIAVAVTLVSIAGFVHHPNAYYIFMGLLGLVIIVKSRLKFYIGQPWILMFLFACLISLVVNNPPDYFNAWNRLGLYVLVLVIVSPLFTSPSIAEIRRKILHYIMVSCVLLSVGSFFAYFLGINFFDRGDGYLEIGAGNFSGLMNHSIVLGHFAGLSTAFMLSKTLAIEKWKKRLFLIAITFICFGACLLSASRNGIISCLAACMIVFISYFRKNLSRGILIGTSVVLIALAAFPVWGNLTDFLREKNERNVELGGSIVFSREQKFNARIMEFKSSPITGIGFCTIDQRYDTVNLNNGQIEPGSSLLAVASMTGILGLISFLFICLLSFKRAWKLGDRYESCLLTSLLVFYLIHQISEGYLLAPRSFFTLVFWLILGAIYGSASREDHEIYDNL